jgi:hypothetical protein
MRQAAGVKAARPNSPGWSRSGKVAEALTTVGEHDHQVAQHMTAVVRAGANSTAGTAAKPA